MYGLPFLERFVNASAICLLGPKNKIKGREILSFCCDWPTWYLATSSLKMQLPFITSLIANIKRYNVHGILLIFFCKTAYFYACSLHWMFLISLFVQIYLIWSRVVTFCMHTYHFYSVKQPVAISMLSLLMYPFLLTLKFSCVILGVGGGFLKFHLYHFSIQFQLLWKPT